MTTRKKTVLIAEDENFIAKALMHKLVAAGIEVRIAKNGLEGLKMLQDDGIDLALVDILMPRMDGLNMLREFQKGKKKEGAGARPHERPQDRRDAGRIEPAGGHRDHHQGRNAAVEGRGASHQYPGRRMKKRCLRCLAPGGDKKGRARRPRERDVRRQRRYSRISTSPPAKTTA
jgi:CheY-like chemotaxis protein